MQASHSIAVERSNLFPLYRLRLLARTAVVRTPRDMFAGQQRRYAARHASSSTFDNGTIGSAAAMGAANRGSSSPFKLLLVLAVLGAFLYTFVPVVSSSLRGEVASASQGSSSTNAVSSKSSGFAGEKPVRGKAKKADKVRDDDAGSDDTDGTEDEEEERGRTKDRRQKRKRSGSKTSKADVAGEEADEEDEANEGEGNEGEEEEEAETPDQEQLNTRVDGKSPGDEVEEVEAKVEKGEEEGTSTESSSSSSSAAEADVEAAKKIADELEVLLTKMDEPSPPKKKVDAGPVKTDPPPTSADRGAHSGQPSSSEVKTIDSSSSGAGTTHAPLTFPGEDKDPNSPWPPPAPTPFPTGYVSKLVRAARELGACDLQQ